MKAQKLNILVLFAGAGLSTRGLLNAGHSCTDIEIDPYKQYLSTILNPEADHILSDVQDLDPEFIASFDAIWASPPCQKRSLLNTTESSKTLQPEMAQHLDDLLAWSLALENDILWVENVIEHGGDNSWGQYYNAAQFLEIPVQVRQRIIGGRHRLPSTHRGYKPSYKYDGWHVSPAVTASLWKRTNALRTYVETFLKSTCEDFHGYVPTIDQVAWLQGINRVPVDWYDPPSDWQSTYLQWERVMYEGIGNGVPVYMAQAFGEAYSQPQEQVAIRQPELFEFAA